MRRILLAPLILALSSPAFAGIPESLKPTKWMRINESWLIDTEDVELKGSKLRFYVERQASKDEVGERDYIASYVGKLRLRCSDFSTKIEGRKQGLFGSYYLSGAWEKIRPDMMAYELANYFCFLTGVEGYTREGGQEKIGFGGWIFNELNSSKLKIGDVINDSPAGKSGAMEGDVIISINGRSASGMGYEEALQIIGREEGKKVSMVLQRTNESGKSNELKITFRTGKFLDEEPDWVKQIIKTVQAKPTSKERNGQVDCNSRVWRNRPECLNY